MLVISRGLYDYMQSYASRTVSPGDPRDVAHDACVKLVKYPLAFQGGDALAYVRACVDNAAKDAFHRRAQSVPLDDEEGDQAGYLLPHASYQPVPREEDFGQEVADALQRLSASQYETLFLHVLDGLKYREVAEAQASKTGTVGKRIHCIRERLRPRLREYAAAEYGIGREPSQDRTKQGGAPH